MTEAAQRLRHDPAPIVDPVIPPAPSTIDLHAHSTRSDGVLEPGDLVAAAAAAGVRLFSLTDHDTLAGYRTLRAGPPLPARIELVPGIEINAVVAAGDDLWEGELHILGLGVDPDDLALEDALTTQRVRRRERFTRTVARLRELGLPIDAQLEARPPGTDDAVGRPTVARALVAAGYVATVEEAFQTLIGRGTPAYVPREGLGPVEAIQAIRQAGGLASLAHFRDAGARIGMIRELMALGLDGLEAHHRSFDRPTMEEVSTVARDLGLIPTGGTDYHGDTGSYAEAHAGLWVPPEAGEAVRTRLA
jgi:predicted metal-dependent phosphoesterase TrpH